MELEVFYLLGNLKHKVEILVGLAKGQLDDLVLNLVVVKVLHDMKQNPPQHQCHPQPSMLGLPTDCLLYKLRSVLSVAYFPYRNSIKYLLHICC